MNQKPTWVIFDIGNVLFNIERFVKDLANKYKIDPNNLIRQIDAVDEESGFDGKITITEFWRKVLQEFDLEQELDTVMTMWHDEEEYWIKDTKNLLKELQNAGYNLAIITNNWKDQTEHLRKNLSDFVSPEYIFESSVEKLSKPDMKFFQLVEDRIKAKESDILFIDDVKNYLAAARKLHWQVFQYSIGDDLGKATNDILRKLLLH